MKIALVHDYLVQYGGAERVLENFCEMFPYAPIYTLVYDEDLTRKKFKNRIIRTSFLQKWPFSRKQHRLFPLLMSSAIEQFDFSQYDVVLSDSSSFAKGIIVPPGTLHICYMHTPMRYAWDDCQRYIKDFGYPFFIKMFIPFFVNVLRMWDKSSAKRPDVLIANSEFVAQRIQKYYRREADVIHPPVDINSFATEKKKGSYFLMVGRLIAYKRHDIVIQAFNRLGWKLKIVGQGPEENRLKEMAYGNIEFLGGISDAKLSYYYARSKALIFPQEEDFGIVAIEALASGKPLIAYRGGDIVRHTKEPKNVIFFDEQTSEAVESALKKFMECVFDAEIIRQTAKKFDKKNFQKKIQLAIDFYVKQQTK